MRVEVRVFTGLEKYTGTRFGEQMMVDIPENSTIRELVQHLNIPVEEVFSTLVNGLHKSIETILQEGDRVGLFPPVGGG